ncbi:Desumoylating isopeptidase 2 [Durusdinium trenchii]|uniref:Desumoylating isopeptidase 2 n=1 Tax=Durusdinium trenchii TaxID=1381693 RepID=A0ABP0IKQ4_9DINO
MDCGARCAVRFRRLQVSRIVYISGGLEGADKDIAKLGSSTEDVGRGTGVVAERVFEHLEEADDFIPTRAVAVDSFPQTVHVEAKPRRRGVIALVERASRVPERRALREQRQRILDAFRAALPESNDLSEGQAVKILLKALGVELSDEPEAPESCELCQTKTERRLKGMVAAASNGSGKARRGAIEGAGDKEEPTRGWVGVWKKGWEVSGSCTPNRWQVYEGEGGSLQIIEASVRAQLQQILEQHPYVESGGAASRHPAQPFVENCRKCLELGKYEQAQEELRRTRSVIETDIQQITEAFRRFDKDGSGFLEAAECRHMCAYLGWGSEEWSLMDRDKAVRPSGAASAAAVAQGRPPRSSCRCDEPKMVTRISYTSTMRGDPQAALAAIRGIVDQSTAANLTANVSGHMCYDTKLKSVWQVLEGAPEVVSRLWEGICKDERHVVDEDTVHIQQADHRAYPVGWGMRCTRFEPGMASNSDGDCAGTNLMQLMYKSVIHEEALGSVKQIVPRAVEKNRKNGITGWMLYNDRTQVVYQVLEGPPEQVERLWTQIHKDGRHSVLTDTIRRRCIKEREFENWSMGFDEVEQTAWMAQAY